MTLIQDKSYTLSRYWSLWKFCLQVAVVSSAMGLLSSVAIAQPALYGPDAAGIRILSPAPDTDFARPLAAGDFNGDGADEIVIGQSDSYPEPVANVLMIRGHNQRWPETQQIVDLTTSVPDKIIQGENQSLNLPTAFAVGDLNDDGLDDLAMTAPYTSPRGRTNAGRVYVILGTPSLFDGPTTLSLASPGSIGVITFGGAVAGGDLGSQSIFGGLDAHGLAIGDLNGDGIDDLAVGAHLASPSSRGQAGQVYVMFGRTTFAGGQNYDLASPNIRIDGARQYYEAGTQIQIEDLTGDGVGELIIACEAAGEDTFFLSSEGIVYVLRGRSTWPSTLDLLTTWNVKIRGVSDGVNLGSSITVADINLDGFGDLCMGAAGRWYGTSTDNPPGAVEVLYGSSTLGAVSTSLRPAKPNILWTGANPYANMGFEAVKGQFDETGLECIVSSAVFADLPPSGNTNGLVEILRARSSWSPQAVLATHIAPEHDYRIYGPDNGRYGFALATADSNGDGIDEIVVGAPFEGWGEVLVYQLIPTPLSAEGHWTLY